MMRLMLLILVISTNYVKMNCDEEPNVTENGIGVTEKTEIVSADPQILESKTENKKSKNNTSQINKDAEEIRILRSSSSSDFTTKTEAELDVSSKLSSTEASFTEILFPNEKINETQVKHAENEVKQPTRRTNSEGAVVENKKFSENVETIMEELPQTSRSASEIEDRKPEEISEASAESKLRTNEKLSSGIDDTDRKSESAEAEEKSDDSRLNENRETRRMFSATDNIVVDTNVRADTTSSTVEPEIKTAPIPNLNTYNNLNEFGPDTNNKLRSHGSAESSSTSLKANMPVVSNTASQEILNQRYLPKFYPRPELNIIFPNVNSDFQGPRDLPIYLKVKQDEYHSQNQLLGPQLSKLQAAQENKYFNTNNHLQYDQPPRSSQTQGTFTSKQNKNVQLESGKQVARFNQNHLPTNYKSYMENKELSNSNPVTQNQMQQFYQNQDKINPSYKNFEVINRKARFEDMQEKTTMPVNIKDSGNQYPLVRQPQGIMETKSDLQNKQFESGRFTTPYIYPPFPRPNVNFLNPTKFKKDDVIVIPPNIKILFQKLARASLYPVKTNSNIQSNPYSNNPNYAADFTFHDLSFKPRCC